MTCRIDEVPEHRRFRHEGRVYCRMGLGDRMTASLLRDIGEPIVAYSDGSPVVTPIDGQNYLFFFMDLAVEVELLEDAA